MRLADVWVYQGPSVYSHRPVIRYTIQGADAETLAPGLSMMDGLCEVLPGLRKHCCALADEPAPHLFEHACVELQNLAGLELGCVRGQGARVAPHEAVIPYDDDRVAREAATLSLELIDCLLSAGVSPADFERRLREFLELAEEHVLPVQDMAVVRAAEVRDIPVIRVAGRLIQLGHGRHQQRMSGTETTRTNIIGNDLASNKDYARRVCRAVGLPVPVYERVQRKEDAVAAANRIGFPVVVKPNRGKMGAGVSVGMRTDREVREAFDRTRGFGRSVLVEECVAGADYRLLVINGTLEAAVHRVPAHVVGDGVHTVEELVHQANQDPRRGSDRSGTWFRIEFDDQSDRLLADSGLHRHSIAREGQVVYIKRIANIATGGLAIDVTDQVHPENREIAERCARVVGLDVAGIDLIVPDITQPMRAQGGVINEVNSRPGLKPHLWPGEGPPRDVVGPIVSMLFPQGARSRIPIATVTGNGDTGEAARVLSGLLSADGSVVGLATGDGVFIDGKRADGGGITVPSATRVLLLDPAVEVAVIEVPPAEALRYGLGHDWADVCAVVNDRPIEPPELVEAISVVVASTRSHVVLSAEDAATFQSRLHPEAHVTRLSAARRGPADYAAALARCLGRKPKTSSEVSRASSGRSPRSRSTG
jgi:cyanophycin synthetase